MRLDLTVVDAFTDHPFTGNPAAVAVVEAFPADELMQAVAMEMNLSETAFVAWRPDGDYDLRWFTPSVEVGMCGHATLASAHVLGGTARFQTRGGVLTCGRGAEDRIEMDFPADPPTGGAVPPALTIAGVRWFGRARFCVLVELEDAAAVRTFQPDLPMLAALGSQAVIITAAGDAPGIDCVSRVFGPNVGIPEDPVTGSAHCTLAVFWGERTGRDSLVGEQASARGGTVHMRRAGDRVVLGGRAVTVSEVRLTA
ncbi:MAG TPA: PhzF family phenazine biosynthesis protein [Acidimicrobiales bacterium]|jgi:predicted PhzF superfamily epimerase YddE/YHI9|nr:PhzF family phenazine biosynthesis protein [Acidimicrobiales bacterium]